jgi:hypothetical protein
VTLAPFDDVDEKLAQSTSTRNRQSNSSVSSTATTALKKDDDNDAANRQQAQSNIAMAVVENHLKTLITQRFDPKKADTIWGQKVVVFFGLIGCHHLGHVLGCFLITFSHVRYCST